MALASPQSGCSGNCAPEFQVPSLPGITAKNADNSPSAAGSSTADASMRPQERLDDTPAKDQQYRAIYVACLSKHGLGPNANGQVSSQVESAALAACKDEEPLPPPELDPARSPNYAKDVVAMVKCLNADGIDAVVVPSSGSNPISRTVSSANVPDDYTKLNTSCLVKSFG